MILDHFHYVSCTKKIGTHGLSPITTFTECVYNLNGGNLTKQLGFIRLCQRWQ